MFLQFYNQFKARNGNVDEKSKPDLSHRTSFMVSIRCRRLRAQFRAYAPAVDGCRDTLDSQLIEIAIGSGAFRRRTDLERRQT